MSNFLLNQDGRPSRCVKTDGMTKKEERPRELEGTPPETRKKHQRGIKHCVVPSGPKKCHRKSGRELQLDDGSSTRTFKIGGEYQTG